jgi:hypothetical protein
MKPTAVETEISISRAHSVSTPPTQANLVKRRLFLLESGIARRNGYDFRTGAGVFRLRNRVGAAGTREDGERRHFLVDSSPPKKADQDEQNGDGGKES